MVPWLVAAATLAFSLIVLGGVVRLTRAGLSITEWQPISGALPPIGDAAWSDAFEKYRATPEYTHVNAGMDMDGFRTIFLLEYAHRLLGRVTGLVLALPLIALLVRRKLSLREARPILLVIAAGFAQAVLGWAMVKSGLVDVPHVSPQRLAAHLTVGIALFAALVWMISARAEHRLERAATSRTRALSYATLAIAAVTVAWGGLMAGTHAGLVFPTFPKMGGEWVPRDLTAAIASDAVAIHFTHRALAAVLSIACVALVASSWRTSKRARALGAASLGALFAQIVLGALVVCNHVPIALASLHQANAVLLVGALTALACELSHRVSQEDGSPESLAAAQGAPPVWTG